MIAASEETSDVTAYHSPPRRGPPAHSQIDGRTDGRMDGRTVPRSPIDCVPPVSRSAVGGCYDILRGYRACMIRGVVHTKAASRAAVCRWPASWRELRGVVCVCRYANWWPERGGTDLRRCLPRNYLCNYVVCRRRGVVI